MGIRKDLPPYSRPIALIYFRQALGQTKVDMHLSTRSFTIVHSFLVTSTIISFAKLVNITVDDEFGDSVSKALIQYTPPGAWNYGPTCTHCLVLPSTEQVWNGSWHDVTYYPSGEPYPNDVPENATFTFTGKQCSSMPSTPT